MTDKQSLLEEEVLIVRHAGEIPEIAFHSSIYYLTKDEEGPGLALDSEDLNLLRAQVVARYREIMLRDLDPENRDKSIYRGVKRCIFNWERLGKFLKRERLAREAALKEEIARTLCRFLEQECSEVREGTRRSCLNCTWPELVEFAASLGIEQKMLPADLPGYCHRKKE